MAFSAKNENCTFERLLIKSTFYKEMFQMDEFTGENLIFV